MRLLLEEDRRVDTDKLNLTFGGSETQLDILSGFENVADAVLTLINSSHVDCLLIDDVEHANEDHAVGHDVPQVVTFRVDGEALTHKLVVVENIVEKSCDGVPFFKLVRVLGALNKTSGGSGLAPSVLSAEVSLFFLDLEDHLEVLVPVDDTVAVGVVFSEKIFNLLLGHISTTHIF